ncbi:hypothetical protein LINPERPRIM_LOCUS22208 [Linum perenne]
MVDPKVISCVAYQRTVYELKKMNGLGLGRSCFLPANLNQLAMNHHLTPLQAFEDHKFTFLPTAYKCDQMFLPMIDNNEHWYLVVISLKDKKVYMMVCDSDKTRHAIQKQATNFMMEFIYPLLRLVYAKHGALDECPNIRDFQLQVLPIVPEENNHNSGLWVCTWIDVDSKYLFDGLRPINLKNPMELAVNLVMSHESSTRKQVLTKVDKYRPVQRQRDGQVRRRLYYRC